MIRIGQIGIGHNHGAAKMESVRKFPRVFDVVGYAPENDEWKRERGSLPAYEGLPCMSIDELLAKCDAVMVECEVPQLTSMAQRCVDAGKHIHLDKPASGTLDEYGRMLDSAKEKGLTVQLAYMYRYNPAVQKCLKWKEDGRFGDITMVKAEMSTFHDEEYKRWMSGFRGGMMYILGAHMLDLAMLFLGEPERVTSFFSHSGLDGIDYPDNTLAVLEYPHAIGRVFASAVERNGWGNRQLVVSGTKGKAHIMPLEKSTRLFWSDAEVSPNTYQDMKIEVPVPDPSWYGRYDAMMLDFHDCVIGKKENPFTYEHEYAVQKALLEICEADKRERFI